MESRKDDPDEYDVVDLEKLDSLCQEDTTSKPTISSVIPETQMKVDISVAHKQDSSQETTGELIPESTTRQAEEQSANMSSHLSQWKRRATAYYTLLPKEILDIYQRYWEYNFATK